MSLTLLAFPFEQELPTVFGFTIPFILFGILGAYVLLRRPQILSLVSRHPVFLSGYSFIGIGLFMEAYHNSWNYVYVFRFAEMLVGGILIATICRDRLALKCAFYGRLLGSMILAILLFTSSYGSLSHAKADDYKEAQMLRGRTFSESTVQTDINTVSFLIVQGALIALAFAVSTKAPSRHYFFLVIAGFCALASLLSMSRGGLVILLLSSAVVLFYRGIMSPKAIITGVILTISVIPLIPDSVLSRFTLSQTRAYLEGGEELKSRERVYTAIIEHLPEYFVTGVGINNFDDWGMQTGLWDPKTMHVSRAHNCYAQITIYWGVTALLAYLMLIWKAYRSLPIQYGTDPLRLSLLGIAVSVLLETMVIHGIQRKEFSIALGLIVGCHLWIWPPVRARKPGKNLRRVVRLGHSLASI